MLRKSHVRVFLLEIIFLVRRYIFFFAMVQGIQTLENGIECDVADGVDDNNKKKGQSNSTPKR